jgi:hypothetical protein
LDDNHYNYYDIKVIMSRNRVRSLCIVVACLTTILALVHGEKGELKQTGGVSLGEHTKQQLGVGLRGKERQLQRDAQETSGGVGRESHAQAQKAEAGASRHKQQQHESQSHAQKEQAHQKAKAQQQQQHSHPHADSERMSMGGDRDAHGCIASAGMVWCESEGKCAQAQHCNSASAKTSEVTKDSDGSSIAEAGFSFLEAMSKATAQAKAKWTGEHGYCELCIYSIHQVQYGSLPSCGGANKVYSYSACSQVVQSMLAYAHDVMHLISYGCYQYDPYKGWQTVKPCPAHVICGRLPNIYDQEKQNQCPADFHYRFPHALASLTPKNGQIHNPLLPYAIAKYQQGGKSSILQEPGAPLTEPTMGGLVAGGAGARFRAIDQKLLLRGGSPHSYSQYGASAFPSPQNAPGTVPASIYAQQTNAQQAASTPIVGANTQQVVASAPAISSGQSLPFAMSSMTTFGNAAPTSRFKATAAHLVNAQSQSENRGGKGNAANSQRENLLSGIKLPFARSSAEQLDNQRTANSGASQQVPPQLLQHN